MKKQETELKREYAKIDTHAVFVPVHSEKNLTELAKVYAMYFNQTNDTKTEAFRKTVQDFKNAYRFILSTSFDENAYKNN
jgi:hypothetical protein